MALIICPECKRKVSDKATSCPGCGYPMQQDQSLTRKQASRTSNSDFDDVMRENQHKHNNFVNFMEWMHEFNMNNLKIWRKPW